MDSSRGGLSDSRPAGAAGGIDPRAWALQPGEVLADVYKVVRFVGAGGMAQVFEAHHEGIRRDVAIKVPPPEVCHNEDASERLLDEARRQRRLEHPNITRIFDCGRVAREGHAPITYIAMELVTGPTLKRLILLRRPRPTPKEALAILRPLAEAIDHAHAEGFVHRDIKPANILFTEKPEAGGVPKIIDFGLAAEIEQAATRSGLDVTATQEAAGTPLYMSPEALRGDWASPSMDLWSLTVVTYELLTGELPFPGPISALTHQIQFEPPRRPEIPGVEPAVRNGIRRVLLRGLEKRPEQRFPSAVAFLEAFAAAAGGDEQAALRASGEGPAAVSARSLPEVDGEDPEARLSPRARRERARRRRVLQVLGATAVLLGAFMAGRGSAGSGPSPASPAPTHAAAPASPRPAPADALPEEDWEAAAQVARSARSFLIEAGATADVLEAGDLVLRQAGEAHRAGRLAETVERLAIATRIYQVELAALRARAGGAP